MTFTIIYNKNINKGCDNAWDSYQNTISWLCAKNIPHKAIARIPDDQVRWFSEDSDDEYVIEI